MRARIYKPARNAMQSGTARTRNWVLEFAPDSAMLHESEERSLHGNGDLISPLIKLRLKEVREQKLKFNQMLQMMEEEL